MVKKIFGSIKMSLSSCMKKRGLTCKNIFNTQNNRKILVNFEFLHKHGLKYLFRQAKDLLAESAACISHFGAISFYHQKNKGGKGLKMFRILRNHKVLVLYVSVLAFTIIRMYQASEYNKTLFDNETFTLGPVAK